MGLIHSKHRNRLGPETVEKLVSYRKTYYLALNKPRRSAAQSAMIQANRQRYKKQVADYNNNNKTTQIIQVNCMIELFRVES
jgi:hypothetical protein